MFSNTGPERYESIFVCHLSTVRYLLQLSREALYIVHPGRKSLVSWWTCWLIQNVNFSSAASDKRLSAGANLFCRPHLQHSRGGVLSPSLMLVYGSAQSMQVSIKERDRMAGFMHDALCTLVAHRPAEQAVAGSKTAPHQHAYSMLTAGSSTMIQCMQRLSPQVKTLSQKRVSMSTQLNVAVL